MLFRVGQALSRLVRPIATSHLSLTSTPSQDERASQQESAFQRQKPNDLPVAEIKEASEAEIKNPDAPVTRAPGLTTAFLHLIKQLQSTRKNFASAIGRRGYRDGGVRKKGAEVRKGMVMDRKAE